MSEREREREEGEIGKRRGGGRGREMNFSQFSVYVFYTLGQE